MRKRTTFILGLCFLVLETGHSQLGADVLQVHPKNPLYFTTDSKTALYLGGHQIFVDVQDNSYNKPFTRNKEKTLNWPAYLDFIESHNFNYLRNWIIFSTGSGSMAPVNQAVARPMPYMRVPGHGKAKDGGLKFDLYQFNDAFFQRLYKRCKDLEERNIYVSIMLFEVYGFGYGEKCGEPPQTLWDGNVFNPANNINGIDANHDKNHVGTEFFYTNDAEILGLQKKYVKKIIDTVNPLDNIFYEIANELYAPEWQIDMIGFIKKYEKTKPKQHLVLFSPGGRLADGKWKVIAKNKVTDSNADCFACMGNWDSRAFGKKKPPINNTGKPGIIDLDHIKPGSNDVAYLWTAFTRGYHFCLYETPYDHPEAESPEWENIRYNIGKSVEYAQKMDLANMKPRPDLSSTKFCLAKEGCEYIIYQQSKSEFTVSGLEPAKRYNLEWYAAEKNQSESSFIYPEKSEVIFIPRYKNMVLFLSP